MAAEAGNTPKQSAVAVHPRWWQMKGSALAAEVCSIDDALESDEDARRSRYLTNLQLYELRALKGLNAAGYYTKDAPEDVIIPVIRSICDTVQADIAGRQRPLPMFMTAGADWKTRRKAKKLGRFVEGVLHQPQGTYVNGWELAVDCFLDCCIYGVGVIHVYVDELTDKVVLDRVQPEEIKVDAREAESGNPLNFFRSFLMDEDKALLEFVDSLTEEDLEESDDDGDSNDEDAYRGKRTNRLEQRKALLRDAIESAAVTDKSLTVHRYGSTRIARSVKVRHAIRLPLSDDDPGKSAYCVPDQPLHVEDWERAEPYVFMRWSRERRGFYSISLVDESCSLGVELNRWFNAAQERMVLCANKRTYVSNSANIDEESLQANEAENVIFYDGTVPPTESNVPALTAADFDFGQLVKQWNYEFPGVSMMSATSRKEPGVTAGIAMRTLQDVAAKRFSVKARYAYEYPFVSLARKIVDAVAEHVERTGRNVVTRLPKKYSVDEIDWKTAKLDSEFDIQIAPASSLPTDPAGRLATVQDLFSAQVISQQTFKRLLDWPDIEQEMSRETAEWEYVESLIERYLDAEEGDETKFEGADGYLLHPEEALLQFSGAYFEAKRDGAPEFNLSLLRRYMQSINSLIERRAAAMQAAAPGPAAPTVLPPAVGPLSAASPAPMGPMAPPVPPMPPGAPPIAA